MLGAWAGDLAWPEVERRIQRGAIAVLPIGAASKEHGRHLPLSTDFRQAAWISESLIAHRDVVVWPVLSYGYYPVFVDYPGSTSLSEQTFINVVSDVVTSIARHDPRKITIVNTGISTIAPLQHIVDQLAVGFCHLLNVYAGPRLKATIEQVCEQPWGGHADEMETSLMLAIDESLVNLKLARPAPAHIPRGKFERIDSNSPNYSPDGVNGDPTLASIRKGQRLLSALLDDVLTEFDNPL